MKHLCYVLLPAIALAACAKHPNAIAPAYVPETAYQSLDCEKLVEERARVMGSLATAETRQTKTASGDAAGVFWLGMPLSSMKGGDVEGQVAQLKGERDAVDRVLIAEGCASKDMPSEQ